MNVLFKCSCPEELKWNHFVSTFSGEMELTFDNLKHVYRIAEKSKVEHLISDCKSFVEQEVTSSNCIKLMMCAKEMSRKDIENKAFNNFMVSNPILTLHQKNVVDMSLH